MLRKKIMILGCVGGLGTASTDMFVPLLANLAEICGISPYLMNFSITAYFFSCVIGNLFFMYIQKMVSNVKINYLTIFFFSLGALLTALHAYYPLIVMGRVLQGLSFGMLQANLISSIRKASSENFGKVMSTYTVAAESLCLFAPIIAVFLADQFNWRLPFFLFSLVALSLMKQSSGIIDSWGTQRNERDERDERVARINFKLILQPSFLFYNMMSMLLIGTGWGFLSLSSYYLPDSPNALLEKGAFCAGFTILYIFGSYCFEKGILNPTNIRAVMISCFSAFFLLLVYFYTFEDVLSFVCGILIFGWISGGIYGHILHGALRYIPQEQINVFTSLSMIFRQLSSALFVGIFAWLYDCDKEIPLLFGSFGVLIMILLMMGEGKLLKSAANEDVLSQNA